MGRSAWQDGRRAWQRLNGWHQDGGTAVGSEGAAMKALGDIRLVRGLLGQAEMGAVRAARREGRSWAEIATMLGVTRQSAWERWRDLEDREEPAAAMGSADVEAAMTLVADELLGDRRRSVLPGSILPAKSRIDGDRAMLAVRFDIECPVRDSSYISFWGLDRAPNGWRLSGGMSSSRLGEGGRTSRLWFRSGGWGGDDGWCFGAVTADPSVRRVRVDTGGGSTVEDTVEDGIVLVIARDGDLGRATVEMFDAGGGLMRSGRLSEPAQ